MTMLTKDMVIKQLRAINQKQKDTLKAVTTWVETYIDPHLEVDKSNITLFRSEGLELKKILEADG